MDIWSWISVWQWGLVEYRVLEGGLLWGIQGTFVFFLDSPIFSNGLC